MANKDEKVKKKKTFFKDFKAELKRVTWPTPKQLVNNTVGVIFITLIVAVIVFVLDLTFDSINKYGINGLKGIVENNNSVSVEEMTDTENVDTIEDSEVNENTETDTEESNGEEINNEENTTNEAADTTEQ